MTNKGKHLKHFVCCVTVPCGSGSYQLPLPSEYDIAEETLSLQRLDSHIHFTKHPATCSSPNLQKKAVLMADTPILLQESQYHRLKAVLARLRLDSAARVVFLVDKDGQEIAAQGEIGTLDTTSLASLAAGNVAATGGMAQLIGEKEFPTLSHEGERESIHISVIGRLLLIVVFDERSTLGLVKLRSRQISQQLSEMITEITQVTFDDHDSPFAGITDEDIDSLFK
jgi:predicted regulator of Ras-like GTPase activity (Roadblock/LC7/MglB family)